MGILDFDALAAAPVTSDPYDHLLAVNLVRPEVRRTITSDYPQINKSGSFTLDDVDMRGAFRQLIDELSSDRFRAIIEAKFGLDLAGTPTLFTVRGVCAPNDGQIHTDSKSKIFTVLLYLNDPWVPDEGRLRLLRNGEDLDAFGAEISPDFGTLLAFRRTDRSWHGHKPFAGPRRVVQMNWVATNRAAAWQQFIHRLSAAVKRLTPAREAAASAA
jgi:SM-20-related protein